MAERVYSFTIDTEVAPALIDDMFRYMIYYQLLPRPANFTNIGMLTHEKVPILTFTLLGPAGTWFVHVKVIGSTPILVEMTPTPGTPSTVLDELKDLIITSIQIFEERVRRTTLYFAWTEEGIHHPEEHPRARQRILDSLFSESMLLLFIIFMSLSLFMFWILGPLTPIMLMAIQLLMVLYSDKIVLRMGRWRITEENPNVYLLQYHLPYPEYRRVVMSYGPRILARIKDEIYQLTLGRGREIDCKVAQEVFQKYGITCIPELMVAKKVDVYSLVKEAASRFGLPVPKITISNIMLPNAAAAGPSPSRGTILITTGLLVQLEEDEILGVLGHEFSHLKGRDPLAMFALTAAEYLLRIYVLWPLVFYLPFIYYFLAFSAVYFIAKFFEAKADLEAAKVIGEPQVLAEALRKIGFRKLQYEKIPSYRIQSWLTWDPHPPLYFRIKRLESLKTPIRVKHLLLRSALDCISGFLSTFS